MIGRMDTCKSRTAGIAVMVCTLLGSAGLTGGTAVAQVPFKSRADSLPRKVLIASAIARFSGPVDDRLALAAQLLDEAAGKAQASPGVRGLDLVVFPEFAWLKEDGLTAAEQAVDLDGPVVAALGEQARRHQTWIVAPMTLREREPVSRSSNAAVLLNREGRVAGVFRKVHPMVDAAGEFEGGVMPGDAYPVFECDFGRLGVLICWDMGYPEAWSALAAAGAEIVAVPSASPQTLRPAAEALRHHLYVVTSTPRDNASVFDPLGRTVAQVTQAPGMVVQEVDLAYAILHWSEGLEEGRALQQRFGERVGFDYSSREDTGLFFSNDPRTSIGSMVRELGLREMPAEVERMKAAREKAVGSPRLKAQPDR